MTNPGIPGATPPPPPNYPPPPPARSGGGMPKWLIILLVVLLVVIVGCCGGFVMCTYLVKRTAQNAVESAGMTFGGTLPASFPKDVPVHSAFTPTFSIAPPAADGGTTTFSGKEDPAKVGEFYDKEMSAGGWTKTSDSSIGGGITQTYTKDDREVTISAHGSRSDSNMVIEWNKKGGTRPGGEPADREENTTPARPAGGGGGGNAAEAAPAAKMAALPASKMPANFPTDVPVYTGLTPNMSRADKTNGSGMVMLTGKVDKDKMVAYYEKELEGKGWKQEQNQDLGVATIMTYSKESRRLTLTASPNADTGDTTVTISYQQE